jgi:amino-acid N-acetyltransferase
MEIITASNHRAGIEALLAENKLPVNDLPESLENFFAAISKDELVGVIGLEIYGRYGLLRSLAIKSGNRNQGIAGQLVAQIETFAKSKGLEAIYLLTETADKYFDSKHYERIARAEVPAEVRQSSEFSFVCPQSAVTMKKMI